MAPATTSPRVEAGGRPGPATRASGAVLAAITALALGTISMIGFAAGNHRWDGPVMIQVSGSHGIHYVDVLGVVPLGAGVLLAVWCLRRAERADD
jgi:glycerol uptake facilitator-like aquaporin